MLHTRDDSVYSIEHKRVVNDVTHQGCFSIEYRIVVWFTPFDDDDKEKERCHPSQLRFVCLYVWDICLRMFLVQRAPLQVKHVSKLLGRITGF